MPNHLNYAVYRRIKRVNDHLGTIIEMIEQGQSCAEISQQIQAVDSAIENAKKALIHDDISLGFDRSVESTDHIQVRQADRERKVLAVAISSEEEDNRIFMRFAKDLGFDLDAIHLLYPPEYRDRTTTVSETKSIAVLAENGPSQGASYDRLSLLRLGAASRVILVAVGSRVILVAIFAAVLWVAITLADRHPAVHHPGGTVTRGELIGPNGAGKSTLFKGTMGILKPLEGKLDREGARPQLVSLSSVGDMLCQREDRRKHATRESSRHCQTA